MILPKETIKRYMRHIIMPEIGGAGQKQLLESAVLVCSENVHNVSAMLFYLAATGIADITCLLNSSDGFDKLSEQLKDLNPDVRIMLVGSSPNADEINSKYSLAILQFECSNKLTDIFDIVPDHIRIPVIFAASNNYLGAIKSIKDSHEGHEAKAFFEQIRNADTVPLSSLSFLTKCLLGTLTVIEAVKLILDIGTCPSDTLYFNLITSEFTDALHNSELQIDISRVRKDISDFRVLIVGSGGLGSPVAFSLAQSGIKNIGLVDFDTVEISNLNRQILHSTSRIGIPKVQSGQQFLKAINPEINITAYHTRFSKENALELIENYDIVIDGLDNLPTRYLLNDACYLAKKPFVEAGVLGFNGLATMIVPDKGPCYRCTFPETNGSNPAPSCAETGVLGPVPGVMGFLQAAEAIKYAAGIEPSLMNKMLLFDAGDMEFALVDIAKEPECKLCGNNPVLHELSEYAFMCTSRKESI